MRPFADKRTTLGSVAEAVSDDAVPAPYLNGSDITANVILLMIWSHRFASMTCACRDAASENNFET